ncbi:MAG: hypothetical protein ACTHJ5_19235 [Ilyomonas sp.]
MSEFWKKTLLFTLLDFASLLLLFTDNLSAFAVIIVLLILQLIAGFAFSFSKTHRLLGQSLLASFGLFVLIGFSVCSIVIMAV